MTALDLLLHKIPAPREPQVDVADWQEFEQRLRICLPADYRELIDTYGRGGFYDWLRLFPPGAEGARSWLEFGFCYTPELAESMADDDDADFAVEPGATNSLLACGNTIDGDTIFWRLVDPRDPATWTIVVDHRQMLTSFSFDGTLTEFLVSCFCTDEQADFLPLGLEEGPAYTVYPLETHDSEEGRDLTLAEAFARRFPEIRCRRPEGRSFGPLRVSRRHRAG